MLWRPHVVLTITGQLLAMLMVLPCASLAQSTLHTGDTLQVTFSVPSGLSFTPNVIDLAIGSINQTCTVVNETIGTQTQTAKFFNGTALLGTYSATTNCIPPNQSPPFDPLAYFSSSTFCNPEAPICGTVVDFTAVLNSTLSGVITTTIDNGTLTFDLSDGNVVVRFCSWDSNGNGPCHAILTPTSVQIIPAGGNSGPSLSSLSPNSATAGGAAFTLTVNGSGFVSGSTVQWNGSALPTTYVSASQLTASVSASFIASQGTANVTVQNSGGTALSPLTFTINQSGAPALTSGSLANGATYVSGGLVPGSWAQVKGKGLSPVSRTWTSADFQGLGNNLPMSLNGVSVTVNNQPAAIYFIDPGQISFQAPNGITGTATVQVTNNGQASNTITASVAASAPGIFPVIVNGTNYPAGVFLDGKLVGDPSVNTAFRNAKPGDIVQLFATGLSSTPAGVQPMTQTVSGVTVTIGSTTVPASFAGLVAVGEFQINFIVPQIADGVYPISITVNGVASPQQINTSPPASLMIPVHQ